MYFSIGLDKDFRFVYSWFYEGRDLLQGEEKIRRVIVTEGYGGFCKLPIQGPFEEEFRGSGEDISPVRQKKSITTAHM